MLVDRQVLNKIVDAASIRRDELVLEAGSGYGILTKELCKIAKHVISYEIDKKLYMQAQEYLQFQNLELANADLFATADLRRFDVFVSNLPYSRSRDAFEWLAVQKFNRAIVMVQEEFAEKLAAKPGNKRYRAISALASYCFDIEKLFSVGKWSFKPRPKVESATIRIIPVNTVEKETIRALNFFFSRRNRRASAVFSKMGVHADFGQRRIDELTPVELINIAESMSSVCPIR